MAEVQFRDIDLRMTRHPITGDVSSRVNGAAIVQSLQNIIMSNVEEFQWNYDMGTGISNLLFNTNDALTRYTLQQQIDISIKQYEPRVSVQTIEVVAINLKGIKVRVVFLIKSSQEIVEQTFDLVRTR